MSIEILRKRFMKMLFSIYMTLLISVIYFPLPIAWGENIRFKNPVINLRLLESTIGIYNRFGLGEVIKNISGNLILLSPLIFFICYYFKTLSFNMVKCFFIALGISLFIECSQVTLSVIIPNFTRTFDVIDLVCNSISGIIGYKVYSGYKKFIM